MEGFAIIEPVARSNLSQEIIKNILKMIASGEVKQGDRLPPERILSDMLKVGRSSLREAISVLTAMGILEVRAGGGTYVINDGSSIISNSIEWGVLMNTDSIKELIQVRYLLEPWLASMAAKYRTEDDIVRIKKIITKMDESKENIRFVEHDIEFHVAVAKASKNRILMSVIDAIQAMLRVWIKEAIRVRFDMSLKVEEHIAIFNAIESSDPQKANIAMINHLDKGKERLFLSINEHLDGDLTYNSIINKV